MNLPVQNLYTYIRQIRDKKKTYIIDITYLHSIVIFCTSTLFPHYFHDLDLTDFDPTHISKKCGTLIYYDNTLHRKLKYYILIMAKNAHE